MLAVLIGMFCQPFVCTCACGHTSHDNFEDHRGIDLKKHFARTCACCHSENVEQPTSPLRPLSGDSHHCPCHAFCGEALLDAVAEKVQAGHLQYEPAAIGSILPEAPPRPAAFSAKPISVHFYALAMRERLAALSKLRS